MKRYNFSKLCEKGLRAMNDIIENFLKDRFVSDVGFALCTDSPFEGLNNAISMVFKMSDAVIDQIDSSPTHTYFQHYRTMNAYIDSVSLQVPASQSVDDFSGIFSHKKAAVRAGLGSIGKSALFLSNLYGPRVRLGTVFTNAPLDVVCEKQKDLCKNCDVCAKNCGAMAIRNKNYEDGMEREDIFDAHACSQYMKDKFKHIGRGAVCGVCMRVCPIGKKG